MDDGLLSSAGTNRSQEWNRRGKLSDSSTKRKLFVWWHESLTWYKLILQIISVAKKGDVVGEIGVLCYRPQLFTVRTRSLCQILRLNRPVFLSIVQSNVGDGTIIINNLLQVYFWSPNGIKLFISHLIFFTELGSDIGIKISTVQFLKDKQDPVMDALLREIESMLTKGRLDLPLTLSFAVVRGDDMLLHQLLKRGLDPNESDNNGHTALVWIYPLTFGNLSLFNFDFDFLSFNFF